MIHQMTLWDSPFHAIKEGRKNIEMRLLSEKRKQIQVEDVIEFSHIETNEKLICIVTNLFVYSSFEELYKHHDKISLGYREDEIADPRNMLAYYKQEDIDKFGVLGIELKLSE